MLPTSEPGLGIAPRTLAAVLAGMVGLFTLTTFVSRWYEGERTARAQQYFESGEQLALQGRLKQAIEQYRNALAFSHATAAYRLALAEALIKIDRFEEAEIYLRELLQADPGEAIPNLLLARIAARQGRTTEAANYYHRAIYGYWPRQAEAERMQARWELVELMAKTGRRQEVLAELLQISGQAPSDPAVKKRVGRMLLVYGSAAQAAEIFRGILRQNRRDEGAQEALGQADLLLGNYFDAQAAFEKAVRDNPGDAAARKNLELVNAILALDPTLRGLSSPERYRRSRVLVEKTSAALDQCPGKKRSDSAAQLLDSARKSLSGRRPRSYGDAAEQNIALAQQLWTARVHLCGAANGANQPLARVLARLSK